jgi:hypothetical protein
LKRECLDTVLLLYAQIVAPSLFFHPSPPDATTTITTTAAAAAISTTAVMKLILPLQEFSKSFGILHALFI